MRVSGHEIPQAQAWDCKNNGVTLKGLSDIRWIWIWHIV